MILIYNGIRVINAVSLVTPCYYVPASRSVAYMKFFQINLVQYHGTKKTQIILNVKKKKKKKEEQTMQKHLKKTLQEGKKLSHSQKGKTRNESFI